MAACRHGGMLSTSAPNHNVQLACNEEWIAFSEKENSFGIYNHEMTNEKPLLFSGHKLSVSALCFGNKQEPVVLGSASEDCVIVWYLKKDIILENSFCGQIRRVTVAKDLGYVQHICFNNSDDMISICIGNEVWIIVIETCELNTVIEGHLGRVTASKFCPCQDNLLVTISEDRTFKVWNVDLKCILYQSSIISAHPFLSLAFHPSEKEVSIGSSNGMVRIFSLEAKFNCIHELDLNKFFAKNKRDEQNGNIGDKQGHKSISWVTSKQGNELQDVTVNMENEEEPGLSVIGLIYSEITSEAKHDNHDVDYHVTSDLLQEVSVLICVTTNAVLVLNVNTCQLISLFDFRDPVPAIDKLNLGEFTLVPLCGACAFAEDRMNGKIVCFLGSLFQNTLHIIHILLPRNGLELVEKMDVFGCTTLKDVTVSNKHVSFAESASAGTSNALVSDCPQISVLSKEPLHENSPLKAELVPKIPEKMDKAVAKKQEKTTKKKSSIENQPVTFRTKIKSSGYTASPRTLPLNFSVLMSDIPVTDITFVSIQFVVRTKMFSPKVNPPKQTKPQFDQKSGPVVKNIKSFVEGKAKEYNVPTYLKDKLSLCSTPVAINQIAFSGDGKQLACALSNQTAQVLNIPQTNKQRTYSGHNGAVQSVNFSNDGKLLLTSSADNAASIWSSACSEPILTFTNQKCTSRADSKDNPTFSKGVNQAMFYYVDKFILLSSGKTLYLYKYYLDFSKDDLKRYQSKSRYKLVTSFPLQKAQNIVHFACINGFYSYIVLCAGSDRSLEVFDMNVGRRLLIIEDVHARNAYCVKLNEGSKNFSLPSQTYDLFLTTAISDGLKMWDLRTSRCIRKYEGHANRSHPVGMAWSPCSKYFAVGSEDKSAYIYDVRYSSPYHRLTRHTDVVFDVAFHPASSQLVTASLDGKLHFYSDKT